MPDLSKTIDSPTAWRAGADAGHADAARNSPRYLHRHSALSRASSRRSGGRAVTGGDPDSGHRSVPHDP